ncbi:MAG: hypothetical protein IT262_18300 [Saprospiraceae bacterium]|nr:hypothetical protein [Saprospiraceae bacterium]
MKRLVVFFLGMIVIVYVIYYCCEGKMADVVKPDLKKYVLLQSIRNTSDSDDMIIYSIDESYKYDSLDISILEDILNNRHVKYLLTKNANHGLRNEKASIKKAAVNFPNTCT